MQDWLLIGLSVLIFQAQVTAINLGGYLIAFGGEARHLAFLPRLDDQWCLGDNKFMRVC